jgi:hypothetical protein
MYSFRTLRHDADRIGELWRAGRKEEAMAAVPEAYLAQNTLLGSPKRIREQWERGDVITPGVTGLIVGTQQLEALDLIADLAGTREATDPR